jgi:quinol-cytochrome oxidoreductase complex cytochrome b subunit
MSQGRSSQVTRFDRWIQSLYPEAVPARLLQPSYSLAGGWLATALLGICCGTGVVLAFHFRADAGEAYASVCDVTSVVSYGWLVRNVHRFAAEGLLLIAAVHLLRVLLTRSYTDARKGNWLVGICLLGLILLANFTGYLLPWDQTAYWGLTICASMLDAVPLVGRILRELLAGPPPIDGTSLPRLYTLHSIVLPAALLLLAAYHRQRFRRDVTDHASNSANPEKFVAGWPDLWHWELAAGFAALAVLVTLATYVDAPLGGPANPHEPPNPAKAPWYFLWLQELASHVSAGWAVLIAACLVAFVAVVPWLVGQADSSPNRRHRLVTAAAVGIGAAIICLDVIGLLFRGANWSWVVPWR